MGRFRSSKSPINSIKHIIDSDGALAGGGNSVNDIATAVPNVGATFVPVEVRVGATINAFFLSIFIIGASGSGLSSSLNWYIIKTHGDQTTLPTPGFTGNSDVRNQIFHEEKGLAGSADGTPMVFKGVIMVPRGMRRMREGDKFIIVLRNGDSTNDANFCVKAIYKSYF